MKRWRTRGLTNVRTRDGRTITGTTTHDPRVPVSDMNWRRLGTAEVRIVDGEIQAKLPWRWRHANLDIWPKETRYRDEAARTLEVTCELVDVEIVGLTLLGPGYTDYNPWGL